MRPKKYKTPEELQNAIDDYFKNGLYPYEKWTKYGKSITYKPSITGLAFHLGFSDRHSIYDYEKRVKNKKFAHIIKRARLRIEQYYEVSLTEPQVAAGAQFALKQFGWKDKIEVDQNTNQVVQFVDDLKPDNN